MEDRLPACVSKPVAAEAGEFIPALVVIIDIAVRTRVHTICGIASASCRNLASLASNAAWARLRSVMSRAIFEAPITCPCAVLHRRNRQRDIEQRAVLPPPHRLEVIDALAALQPAQNLRLFIQAVRRNENGDRLARSSRRRYSRTDAPRFCSSL